MDEGVGTEMIMAYTLEEFCAESRTILKAEPLADALARIADRLARLLANPAFVAATFSDDMPPGRRVLHHDGETDFHVLAHVQAGNKVGTPHSHGASWAIYGNARAHTDMTEWRRTNPDDEPHAVLEATSRYRLDPGQTKAYGPGVIHSTAHPEKAWVIRVTGTDLDAVPRYRFGKHDRILERA
jgi:predicted metal-dependent enzyme (double-stranded beta helix superfamily)